MIAKNKYVILIISALAILMGYFYKNKQDVVWDFASKFLGESEFAGIASNPIIDKFLKVFGLSGDEVAWCSAYVGYVMDINGYDITSQDASARSWLKFGTKTLSPKRGDIVILWRESIHSWKGHVGFFDRVEGNKVFLLGGNQGNRVSIKHYTIYRVLTFQT